MGFFIWLAICISAQHLGCILHLPGKKKFGITNIQRFFGSFLVRPLVIIYLHFVVKHFITKARKYENTKKDYLNFVLSRFRVFVINLFFLIPACPGQALHSLLRLENG